MATAARGERFEMGRVVNRAFGAIGRNAALFFGLAAILTILPALMLRLSTEVGDPTAGAAFVPVLIVSALLSVVGSVMLQAGITLATIIDLQGGRPAFRETLTSAFKLILPLIGLGILFFLAFSLGSMLLLVPGVVIALMWSVSVPVLVAEGTGVLASFGRSRELTKGARGSIFGLFLVALVVIYLPIVVVPVLAVGFDPAAIAAGSTASVDIVVTILSGFASMLLAALIAATYIELRFVKDGIGAERLAAVFE